MRLRRAGEKHGERSKSEGEGREESSGGVWHGMDEVQRMRTLLAAAASLALSYTN